MHYCPECGEECDCGCDDELAEAACKHKCPDFEGIDDDFECFEDFIKEDY